VTTPRFPTLAADELEAELVVASAAVVVLDDVRDDVLDDLLLPPHAATPTESAAITPTSAAR
jgi:hypothetical protein